jgi:serine/threonine-protein kinase RsbW
MTAESVLLDLPASGKYLHTVSTCIEDMLGSLDGLAEAPGVLQQVQLAIHEACTNVVEHAYEGRKHERMQIILTLDDTSRRLTVELRDSGQPFDPSSVAEPDLEDGQIHGYGLFIMRQVMDEVTYEPSDGANRWRLVKEL